MAMALARCSVGLPPRLIFAPTRRVCRVHPKPGCMRPVSAAADAQLLPQLETLLLGSGTRAVVYAPGAGQVSAAEEEGGQTSGATTVAPAMISYFFASRLYHGFSRKLEKGATDLCWRRLCPTQGRLTWICLERRVLSKAAHQSQSALSYVHSSLYCAALSSLQDVESPGSGETLAMSLARAAYCRAASLTPFGTDVIGVGCSPGTLVCVYRASLLLPFFVHPSVGPLMMQGIA